MTTQTRESSLCPYCGGVHRSEFSEAAMRCLDEAHAVATLEPEDARYEPACYDDQLADGFDLMEEDDNG